MRMQDDATARQVYPDQWRPLGVISLGDVEVIIPAAGGMPSVCDGSDSWYALYAVHILVHRQRHTGSNEV